MAVDPGDDTDLENPQSWNKYAYVKNNPLKTTDPNGKQGIPTNQEAMKQMAAAAATQQAAATPQAQAAGAKNQLQTAENMATAAGQAVCEVAPVMGDVYGHAAVASFASTPMTGPVGLTAAGEAATVALVADGAAYLCDPSIETAANLATHVLGAKVAKDTSVALKGVKGLSPLIKAGLAEITGEAVSGAAKQKSLELLSP
jgi:hypothetical protein